MTAVRADAGVIVSRRHSRYDDVPGERYHYPARIYGAVIRHLLGAPVLVYEPRKGGTALGSSAGGRMAFVDWAVLDRIHPDPRRPDHEYVSYREYHQLPRAVQPEEVGLDPRGYQRAVQAISHEALERVLNLAYAPVLSRARWDATGLIGLDVSLEELDRPIRQVVERQPVRDAAFSYQVVEQAYRGRCAFSGLALVNGRGRAEVDAAHIRPVSERGPDVVQNGVALSKTVHWAFDRGLVSIADDGAFLFARTEAAQALRALLNPTERLLGPEDARLAPHPAFLAWHRQHVFKGAA